MPNPIFLGLNLVPETGGPSKSVPMFQRALGGKVFSLTEPELTEAADVNPVVHVFTRRSKLGRAYMIPAKEELRRLDSALIGVDLLSCHILYRYSAHWVASRARRKNIPFWVVPHGCLDPYVFTYGGTAKRLWMKFIGRRLLRDASCVIFSSLREKEKASKWMSRDNGHVVHWPVKAADLTDYEEIRANFRARNQYLPENRILLYLGRFHSMKHPLQTVEALARANHPNLRLLFVGPTGDVSINDIRLKAKSLGVSSKVQVREPMYGDAKQSLLYGVDGYVSLSERENFNNSAAECLSAAKPLILSPGNDLGPELRSHGCAWLLDVNSINAAGLAMQEFATTTKHQLEKMGRSGRQFAVRELSFEKFATILRKLSTN